MKRLGHNWSIAYNNLDVVQNITYVVGEVNTNSGIEPADKKSRDPSIRFVSKLIQRNTKLTIQETIYITYGCENRTLTGRTEEMLGIL